jgi:hypothetical protein
MNNGLNCYGLCGLKFETAVRSSVMIFGYFGFFDFQHFLIPIYDKNNTISNQQEI